MFDLLSNRLFLSIFDLLSSQLPSMVCGVLQNNKFCSFLVVCSQPLFDAPTVLHGIHFSFYSSSPGHFCLAFFLFPSEVHLIAASPMLLESLHIYCIIFLPYLCCSIWGAINSVKTLKTTNDVVLACKAYSKGI